MNTVEKRRFILLLIVAAVAFHLFASGRLVSLSNVHNPEIRAKLQELYSEYDRMWAGQ